MTTILVERALTGGKLVPIQGDSRPSRVASWYVGRELPTRKGRPVGSRSYPIPDRGGNQLQGLSAQPADPYRAGYEGEELQGCFPMRDSALAMHFDSVLIKWHFWWRVDRLFMRCQEPNPITVVSEPAVFPFDSEALEPLRALEPANEGEGHHVFGRCNGSAPSVK